MKSSFGSKLRRFATLHHNKSEHRKDKIDIPQQSVILDDLSQGAEHRIPAFTVPQPDEAMRKLEEKASKLDVPLKVAAPLDSRLLNGKKLGLEGEHQYVNVGLAIALSSSWLQRTGHAELGDLQLTTSLPKQFIKGLTTASLQGWAQIVHDQFENLGDLVFYLDGAHSPESMEVCGRWFSLAIKDNLHHQAPDNPGNTQMNHGQISEKNSTQILLFNCMSVRDPQLLLSHLMKHCANNGKADRIFMIPYNPGQHWILTIIWENEIYIMDSLARPKTYKD